MTVAARTGYHWFPARGVLFRVRVCECVACACHQPPKCVFSVSLSVLRFQMILANEDHTPLFPFPLLSPRRTRQTATRFEE